MIQFDRVTKRYPCGHEALKEVSFNLGAGEMVFLTGHSGAGKSTLLKLIMLMERPSEGHLFVNNKDLNALHKAQIPFYRRRVGVVFQNHQLLFDRSVFDNVALPLQVSGVHRRDIGRRVQAALDKVGLLKKASLNPVQLSGGEQQRVGIARAVVHTPRILLADEPTGNLDPQLSAEIMTLFEDFRDVGVSVLVATHDIALIEARQQRVLSLSSGCLSEEVGVVA